MRSMPRWTGEMLRVKESTCRLADVEKRAARFRNFEIPSREERENLWPNDLVKVIFEEIGERLWVRVTNVMLHGTYVGVLVSSPLQGDRFMGDSLVFGPENVADISRSGFD